MQVCEDTLVDPNSHLILKSVVRQEQVVRFITQMSHFDANDRSRTPVERRLRGGIHDAVAFSRRQPGRRAVVFKDRRRRARVFAEKRRALPGRQQHERAANARVVRAVAVQKDRKIDLLLVE